MSKFRVVQIQTTASAHLVVRNANGRKLFDIDIHGVTVTITTPLNAEIRIKPDTAKPQVTKGARQ